jgi:uncharacterized coiled-coil protein SlyX
MNAMDGMTMMLKSMGVDPDKLKAMVTETLDGLNRELTALKETNQRMEQKLDLLLARSAPLNANFAAIPKEGIEDFPLTLPEGVTHVGNLDSTS